ncbi:hypothetical protein [Euzebya rosea]|uniref:hypothetical protein n=1 Tax=Euzebya rosea TaxID=2052804 RepID=UPI000D3ED714|nr:hypothetical protein [Euzebya rosea]
MTTTDPNDFAVSETTYADEDRSWASSQLLMYGARETITLDGDLFTDFTDGHVPSGVVIGAAVGELGGPYAGNPNEVVVITRTATGGTVDITLDGETNAGVSIVAATTAAQVLAALEALSNVDAGDVTVTGDAGGPFTVTFVAGPYAGVDAPDLVIDDTDATGGTVLAAVTDGGTDVDDDTNLARGHLLTTVIGLTAGKHIPAVVIRGPYVVHEARLPDGHGLDAAAKRQLSEVLYR